MMAITERTKKKMLKTLAVVLILAGLAALGWWFKGELQYATYENKKEGIIIPYPKGWEMVEHPHPDVIVAFVAPPQSALTPFQESINITMSDLHKNPLTIQQYAETAANQMIAVFGGDTSVAEKTFLRIVGHDGVRIVFQSKAELEMLTVVYGFIYLDVAYNITYMGIAEQYAVSQPKFEHMIKRMKLYF
jgi:hypothetical protein